MKMSMNSNNPLLLPSLLAADIGNLSRDMATCVENGITAFHIDIMDGVFVPPLSFGDSVVKVAKKQTSIFCDIHLMTVHPENHFESFIKAGADRIIFHAEATPHSHKLLLDLRNSGIKGGIAINPGTSFSTIQEVMDLCDVILVMTVNPGWGGQPFISSTVKKIKDIATFISDNRLPTRIEVDGGIAQETALITKEAGALDFVAGSSIFGHKQGIKEGILALNKSLL